MAWACRSPIRTAPGPNWPCRGGLLRDAGHTTVERQAAELLRGATPAGRTVLLVDLPAARLGAALAGADAELRTLPDYLAEHRPGAWKFEPDPDLDLLDTHQPDESWLAPLAAAVPGRGWRPELLPLDHAGAAGRTSGSLPRSTPRGDWSGANSTGWAAGAC
ncbi:hypothetical protein ACFQ0T_17820 [Kitasatospora gansuensis]